MWSRKFRLQKHQQNTDFRKQLQLKTKERTAKAKSGTKIVNLENKNWNKQKSAYFRGTYIDERDAPIPGVP